MSKRLQVLLDPREYSLFQKKATEDGMTLGEWVRQALRKSFENISLKSASKKIQSVRNASKYSYPTADIEQMIAETERGYFSDDIR